MVKCRVDHHGRVCSRCGLYKLWAEYHRNCQASYGRTTICKDCSVYIRSAYASDDAGRSKSLIDEKGRECSKCGEYKLWGEYYLCRKSATGHASQCKECISERSRERYHDKLANPEKYVNRIVVDDNGRTCTYCEEYKPWSEYFKSSSGTRGYTSSCKGCLKVRRILS